MIPAAGYVFGPLTFATPAVLYGGLAAAVPVIIHLVMRQRPRLVPLPTIRFVAASHRAGTRTNWLKHLLLLLLRILLILLVVGILADPSISTTQPVVRSAVPTDAVFCFDDSASMGYRSDGRSRLELARQWAGQLLADESRFPLGSRFATLAGSDPHRIDALTPILSNVRASLDLLSPKAHDRGVADLLRRACHVLAESDRPRKEIYLFNDLTEHSWRDALSDLRPIPADVGVICFDLAQPDSQNFTLELPVVAPRILPAERILAFEVSLRSYDLAATRQIELLADGKVVSRSPTLSLGCHSRQTMELEAGPFQQGIHHLQMRLTQADALEIDDNRYLAVEVGEALSVAIVGNAAPDEPASEAQLLTAMISPQALGPSRLHYVASQIAPRDLPALTPEKQHVVILADVAEPSEAMWAWITRFVHAGGALLVVPGDSMQPTAYARAKQLLGALPLRIESSEPPSRIRLSKPGHPYLRPFQNPGVDSIGERDASRRLIVSKPSERADVLAHFQDRKPAILTRDVGRGRTILLAVSPSPEWGNFGTQAAPVLVFLHTILRHHAPQSTCIVQGFCGAPLTIKPKQLPADATGWVRPVAGGNQSAPLKPLERDDQGAFVLATALPGNFDLEFRYAALIRKAAFSVNLPKPESDPARIDPDRLAKRFGQGGLFLARDPAELVQNQQERRIGRSIAGDLALLLLALLVIESLCANRFYGKSAR